MVSAADVVVTAAIIAALRADFRMTLMRFFPIVMFLPRTLCDDGNTRGKKKVARLAPVCDLETAMSSEYPPRRGCG
jgi:hypothetical protein